MSSSQARSVASTLRVLQVLQARGLAWMATVKSRDEVSYAMNGYMATLGIIASELPPMIHVAGTKGKGSTAAMAEAVLRAGGLRTGLFTSPHLISPVERFRIDGQSVDDDEYCTQFWRAWTELGGEKMSEDNEGEVGGIGNKSPTSLPGFNFLTLLAFRIFAAARVDVMVLEVGVGGLLDATNVLPASRVLASCITQLDYDHTEILGPTLSAIAAQKAGIAKKNVPLCVARDAAPEANTVICNAARQAQTLAWTPPPLDSLQSRESGQRPQIALRGRFQRANAALAVALVDAALARAVDDNIEWPSWSKGGRAAILSAARRAGINDGALQRARNDHAFDSDIGTPPPSLNLRAPNIPLPEFYLKGLATTEWPGRAEIITLSDGVRVYVDGAHTALSMVEVSVWFSDELASMEKNKGDRDEDEKRGRRKPGLIFYCGPDKDALSLLLPLAVVLPWESVSVVKPEWSLTPRIAPPLGLVGALTVAGERAKNAGDNAAASGINAALHAIRMSGGGRSSESESGGREEDTLKSSSSLLPTSISWPATLVELWHAATCAPELNVLREESKKTLGLGLGGLGLSISKPKAVLHPSLVAAINDAKSRGCTDILITGSLYLVGDALTLVKSRHDF